MPTPLEIAIAVVGGYLLGSIPFGVIVMRAAGAGDPRAIGSGNIGATNVLRSGRKGLAALTLLGDGGKGAIAVLVAWLATRGADLQTQALATSLAGGAAFLGPIYALLLGRPVIAALAAFMGVLIYIRHAANIRRLLKGEEPRIGAKKAAERAGA